jgi:hypothetical protein
VASFPTIVHSAARHAIGSGGNRLRLMADAGPSWSMEFTDEADARAQLLPTPWVSSWVGRARPGDLHDPDLGRRAAAWAQWSIDNLCHMQGMYDRAYFALKLPARFYDPRGNGPKVRPHLEISPRVLDRLDPSFPDRLALAGNALLFPWWVVSEVTAIRRALMTTQRGSLGDVIDLLGERRGALQEAVAGLSRTAHPQWSVVEGLLVSSPDGLSPTAAGDFDRDEVAAFFPPARDLQLEVVYDVKLREVNGMWASRRVGVWQVRGTNASGEAFSFGVTTPRLTAGSLFKDPLFRVETESVAALLVRGLLLRRLIATHLEGGDAKVQDRRDASALSGPGKPHLRSVPARVGAKLPQASVESAVHFLQAYPNAADAWSVLRDWAGTGYLLTVTEDSFKASHRNCRRYVRRAETPPRDDIDVVLPLAWDVGGNSRVVRVTFARSRNETDD